MTYQNFRNDDDIVQGDSVGLSQSVLSVSVLLGVCVDFSRIFINSFRSAKYCKMLHVCIIDIITFVVLCLSIFFRNAFEHLNSGSLWS